MQNALYKVVEPNVTEVQNRDLLIADLFSQVLNSLQTRKGCLLINFP